MCHKNRHSKSIWESLKHFSGTSWSSPISPAFLSTFLCYRFLQKHFSKIRAIACQSPKCVYNPPCSKTKQENNNNNPHKATIEKKAWSSQPVYILPKEKCKQQSSYKAFDLQWWPGAITAQSLWKLSTQIWFNPWPTLLAWPKARDKKKQRQHIFMVML